MNKLIKSPRDLSFIRGGRAGTIWILHGAVFVIQFITVNTLKDMIGIIKRDQALPCSVQNRKGVAFHPDLVQVRVREDVR